MVATAESTNPPTRTTATSAGMGSAGGAQYTQANQYNQANLYQQFTIVNPGYTIDQVRGELSEFMREAERRHLAASRYQAEASEMRVDNLEQQAMKKHYEVVGRLENNISKIEVRAADRDKFLVSELQSLQEQNMAMQRDHAGNVAIAEAIQAQRLQTVYSNEMVDFRRSNSEFLAEQFSEQFSKFKREESLRMSLTEDQMQAQNDAGLLTPPGISAPHGPQAPSPHVIPESMRGLFAQIWPAGVVQYAEKVQYVSLLGKLTIVHRGHNSGL